MAEQSQPFDPPLVQPELELDIPILEPRVQALVEPRVHALGHTATSDEIWEPVTSAADELIDPRLIPRDTTERPTPKIPEGVTSQAELMTRVPLFLEEEVKPRRPKDVESRRLGRAFYSLPGGYNLEITDDEPESARSQSLLMTVESAADIIESTAIKATRGDSNRDATKKGSVAKLANLAGLVQARKNIYPDSNIPEGEEDSWVDSAAAAVQAAKGIYVRDSDGTMRKLTDSELKRVLKGTDPYYSPTKQAKPKGYNNIYEPVFPRSTSKQNS